MLLKEESSCEVYLELKVKGQGTSKVKSIFLNGIPYFWLLEKLKNVTLRYDFDLAHKVKFQGHLKVKSVFLIKLFTVGIIRAKNFLFKYDLDLYLNVSVKLFEGHIDFSNWEPYFHSGNFKSGNFTFNKCKRLRSFKG